MMEEKSIKILKLLEAKTNVRDILNSYNYMDNSLESYLRENNSKDHILHYASNISYAAQAPKEYIIGMKLLNYHPPAPQAEEMRGGMLEDYAIKTKTYNRKYFQQNPTNNSNKYNDQLIYRLKSELNLSKHIDIKQMHAILHARNSTKDDDGNIINATVSVDGKVDELDNNISKKRVRSANISFSYSDSEDDSEV